MPQANPLNTGRATAGCIPTCDCWQFRGNLPDVTNHRNEMTAKFVSFFLISLSLISLISLINNCSCLFCRIICELRVWPLDLHRPGTHVVKYTCTDSSGNCVHVVCMLCACWCDAMHFSCEFEFESESESGSESESKFESEPESESELDFNARPYLGTQAPPVTRTVVSFKSDQNWKHTMGRTPVITLQVGRYCR